MNEPEYDAFIECWNGERFFEAHEVLEGLWMRTKDRGQQALIQVAAALHHVQRRNLKGARTMATRALDRLRDAHVARGPVDLAAIAAFAQRVREELSESNGSALIAARPRL